MIVGIDFDNTIINYSDLIYNIALSKGFINSNVSKNKQEVRDFIRASKEDGDLLWQEVQLEAYGKQTINARLMSGFIDFLDKATEKRVTCIIISHKTKHSKLDQDKKFNLRKSALSFIDINFGKKFRFYENENIFFKSTRDDKIKMINQLQCDFFIDDLVEVLTDKKFPPQTKKILITNDRNIDRFLPNINIFESWNKISEFILK